MTATVRRVHGFGLTSRWIQLLLGLVCMILISSPQYVWALFTQPMTAALGSTLAELQITFSILIVIQTFLSPWQGVLVDRFGPRVLLSAGIVASGLSWILAATASARASSTSASSGTWCSGFPTGEAWPRASPPPATAWARC